MITILAPRPEANTRKSLFEVEPNAEVMVKCGAGLYQKEIQILQYAARKSKM